MIPKVIRTEKDYVATMRRLDDLWEINPDINSRLGNELDLLITLVELYEDEKWPIGLPSAAGAIRVVMEDRGMTQQDLIPYIGSRSKVSEVLSGKRPLSNNMIRRLHDGLRIPLSILFQCSDKPAPADELAVANNPAPVVAELKRGMRRAIDAGDVHAVKALGQEARRLVGSR